MMGGLEEHIRQLNNYNTIFGTFWFNILCVTLNLVQIITSVVLLGYFHSLITIDYIWWPSIELIRLSILTLLRFDVMLKGVENYSDNRSGFKYTKRMIIICNLIGFFFILIGAPIYLALLSTPTNSLYQRATCYTIFMSVYPIFIAIRIFLTIPMYCTLLIGTNPIWEINQGYQRIDDALATRHRQTQRRVRRAQDGYQYDDMNNNEERRETHEERVQRQMRRQWRIMELERRQMQLAIEESRRDAFRNTRKEQDQEYERALREAKEAKDRAQRGEPPQPDNDANNNDNDSPPQQIQEENMLFGAMDDRVDGNPNASFLSSGTGTDGDDMGMGMGSGADLMDDSLNDMYNMDNKMELDALPAEAAESEECVCVRIRLPNGIRCQRRFHFSATMQEVMLWTYHECMKHRQTHLVNHCQLVSTHPRTVYGEMEKNLKELKFWRPNAKRMLASHLLFVEEL